MYQVLLVDDEVEIRRGLQLKIDWGSLGFSVCGEADNGAEALHYLQAHEVHVLITDIRMPVMDGLALLQACQGLPHRPKIIVLSGYDEFEYARAALQAGASDYLLKPVGRRELSELLRKIHGLLEGQRQEEAERRAMNRLLTQILQERFVLQLINEEWTEVRLITERAEQLRLDWVLIGPVRFLSVEMRPPGTAGPARIDAQRGAFRLACQELARDWDRPLLSFHDWKHPNMVHLLIRSDPDPDRDRHLVEAVAGELQARLQRTLGLDLAPAAGETVMGLAGLRHGYLTSLLTWSKRDPAAGSHVTFPDSAPPAAAPLSPEWEKRIALAIENTDLAEFTGTLRKVLAEPGSQSRHAFGLRVMQLVFLLNFVAQRHRVGSSGTYSLLWDYGQGIAQASEDQAIDRLTAAAAQVMEEIRALRSSSGWAAARAVREYIDEHYAEDLSLAMLADQFHLNRTYLSELFKRYTGQTFSRYLRTVRLHHVKRLLRDSALRLSDIAELVGFADAGYLSNVFQKHYGTRPNAFRSAEGTATRPPGGEP